MLMNSIKGLQKFVPFIAGKNIVRWNDDPKTTFDEVRDKLMKADI